MKKFLQFFEMVGQKGTWKEQHYICQMDNCVWNLDQYPAAWKPAD